MCVTCTRNVQLNPQTNYIHVYGGGREGGREGGSEGRGYVYMDMYQCNMLTYIHVHESSRPDSATANLREK